VYRGILENLVTISTFNDLLRIRTIKSRHKKSQNEWIKRRLWRDRKNARQPLTNLPTSYQLHKVVTVHHAKAQDYDFENQGNHNRTAAMAQLDPIQAF
jgi:hypothetical protein